MSKKLRTQRGLDVIRGKLMVSAATQEEINDFLFYVSHLEALLDETDEQDFFGTEGWRHHLGIDE